jgi:hypothetical protein
VGNHPLRQGESLSGPCASLPGHHRGHHRNRQAGADGRT